MGLTYSTSSGPSAESLLAASMEGDLDKVKNLLGQLIADSDNRSSLASCVNTTDPSGNAAIHGAVFGGHLEVLEFLCSCDANLLLKNSLGCSPLWIAAGYDKIDCLEFVAAKLDAIGKWEEGLMDANSSGDSAFLAAASKGNIAACKSLLSLVEKYSSENDNPNEIKQKMITTSNNSGDNPLKVAVGAGHIEMVSFLLQTEDEICNKYDERDSQSRSINAKNNAGLTPLIVACERNNVDIVKILLNHSAIDVSTCDAKGRNPLAVASFCSCKDVVEYLLSNPTSADLLNEVDENGCTPLWLSARTGDVTMVKLLVDAGADVSIKNNEGLSPEEVAIKFKKEKVQQYFANLS